MAETKAENEKLIKRFELQNQQTKRILGQA
jgi:hypothetical protein